MTPKHIKIWLFFGAATLSLSSCYHQESGVTGWAYNWEVNGGFEKTPYFEQMTGPGLVFIEGGTFTMGQVDDDLEFNWDNQARRTTVSSFYMDETEVTNHDYLEYIYWLQRVYPNNSEIVERALPDTAAWRNKLAYNETMVKYYLRHPAYRDYPVVGVSWLQANDFCKWRTDRVNEQILIKNGLLTHSPDAQLDENHFTTATYLSGQYDGDKGEDYEGIRSYRSENSTRNVKMEDGLLLPDYRLPTEAEWEFAALGLASQNGNELIAQRRTYPWDGHFVRGGDPRKPDYGRIQANFVKGNGDYMGVAGALDDFGDITVPVESYQPNDFGLYNMAGNVNEWVADVYRPLSLQDNNEFRPFRGNVYQTKRLQADGTPADPYDEVQYDVTEIKEFLDEYQRRGLGLKSFTFEDKALISTVKLNLDSAEAAQNARRYQEAQEWAQRGFDEIIDSEALVAADLRKGFSKGIIALPGQQQMRDESLEENLLRTNYQEADNRDYLDGDEISSGTWSNDQNPDRAMYNANNLWDTESTGHMGGSTLISNRSRVYKGGGWDDRAYYLIPGTRRFLDERQSSASIGFRCAMDRVGTPVPFNGQ